MKSRRPVEFALPQGWDHVLDKVQRDLNQALAASDERDKALAVSETEASQAPWAEALARWPAQLQGLNSCAEQAEQQAAEVDAELQAGEDHLKSWLDEASNLRQKLADWHAR